MMSPSLPYQRTLLALVLVVSLLAQMPARVLAWVVPAPLLMEGTSGSFWSGQAARAQLHLGDRSFLLGRLRWQLHPFSLLWLHPSMSIETIWGSQVINAELTLGPTGRVVVESGIVRLDAALFNNLAPTYVGGSLEGDVERLVWSGQGIETLRGRLLWRRAVWQTRTGDVALGDYVAELTDNQQGTQAKVFTLSGPLQVDGQVLLRSSGYQIDLNLAGPATRNTGLRNSLDLLATPVDTGYHLEWQGRL